MDGRRKFLRINRRRELGFNDERTTREAIIGSPNFMQRLKIEAKLDIHRGCVNTICWNDSGYRILSGSDDKQLCITDPYLRKKLATITSGHRANIFSAKFMPCCNDSQIVSCSGDGQISFNNVENTAQHGQHIFNCHYGTAYEVVTIPNDPYTFLSCGEDGTVRWFDLRTKSRCLKDECREDVLINCRRAVTSLAVNPIMPYQLGVGCSDSSVRVFDRRMLGTRSTGNYSGRGIQGMFCRFCPPHLQNKYNRPTSLQYSASGNELLVSYSSDYIYLFGTDAYKKEIAFARQEGASEMRGDASGVAAFPDDENPAVNPIKRLRLRGDWSDTGPKARPRGEQAESQPRLTIIQRMSEMLTRWLDDSTSSHARRIAAASAEVGNQEDTSTANEPGTSTAQPTSSRFSSLQSTSTEEQSASRAMQQRLKDTMTSRIMNKKHGSASVEEPGDDSPNLSSSPTQVDQVSTSSQLVGAVTTARQRDSSELCVSPEMPENETESDRLICGDKEILQEGSSAEGISAISSSVQSCMQIRDSQSDSCPAAQDADGDNKDTSDTQDGNSDSKKRKRSTPSSMSSSSLTDDPALDTVTPDRFGKLRGKRNSKTPRKVTRDGSDDGSSSSDSDDEELAKKKSSGAENLAHKQSHPRDISPPLDRNTTDCSDTRPSSEKYPKLELDKPSQQEFTKSEKTTDTNLSQVSDPKDGTLTLLRKTGEGPSLEASTSSSHDDGRVAGQVEDQGQDQGNVSHPVRKQSEIFALRDRIEDTNPQERNTSQYTTTNQRQRRVSVSGPAGTPPPVSLPASSSSQDLASQSVPEDHLETVRGASASASASTTQERDPESRSITCSESDSEDDFILRPPRRRRRHRHHESNEEEVRRPRQPSVSEFRFRELIRAKREAKEKEELQLSNVMTPEFKMVYKGHRNSRTMIKQANFWGNNYVLSGSDCGHIFIWDRHTAELVMLLEGDKHVVNCVQPHPFDHLLATSGIDYDVKLWSPTADVAHLPDNAAEVMRINELMLDETRDTITVPPSFMLRMLASLNHLRAERRRSRESGSSSESTEEDS